MKPALAQNAPPRDNHAEIRDMRLRLSLRMKELMENYVPLKNGFDGTQLALNTFLWDAFCRKEREGLLLLVGNGADPHSLERRIDRLERGRPL